LTDFFEENLRQHFDFERFLVDHMISCDREALRSRRGRRRVADKSCADGEPDQMGVGARADLGFDLIMVVLNGFRTEI